MSHTDLLKAELKALKSSHELEHGLQHLAVKVGDTTRRTRQRAEGVRELAAPVAVISTFAMVLAGLFSVIVIARRRRKLEMNNYQGLQRIGVYNADAA